MVVKSHGSQARIHRPGAVLLRICVCGHKQAAHRPDGSCGHCRCESFEDDGQADMAMSMRLTGA